jgi:hypothetical protein
VVWRSRSGASFAAEGFTGLAAADVAPVMVDLAGKDPDLEIAFGQPLVVPYRHGRTLWPRTTVMWCPPNTSSPRVLFPPAAVRSGRATSLALRSTSDGSDLKDALERSGIVFPQLSTGD